MCVKCELYIYKLCGGGGDGLVLHLHIYFLYYRIVSVRLPTWLTSRSIFLVYTNMNCECLHFFGWPTVRRSHLPRQPGTTSELQRVFRPVSPSPRHRYWVGLRSPWSFASFRIEELSTISSLLPPIVLSCTSASRSHRTMMRSPTPTQTQHNMTLAN